MGSKYHNSIAIQSIIGILIITSALQGLYAQNTEVDSLVNLLDQHPTEDTVRVNLLQDIASSVILKVCKKSDQKELVVKTINKEHPSANDIARFEYEYKLSKKFSDVSEIVAEHNLIPYANNRVIVMEYINEDPLDKIINNKQNLSCLTALKLSLAKGLSKIHQRKIIHEDICLI